MAKVITYMGGGPDVVTMGEAGKFTRRQPRTVEDDTMADQILKKTSLTFIEGEPPMPTIDEQLTAIAAAATDAELDAIAVDDSRRQVVNAINKRRAELVAMAQKEA